jgi:hypothetical protein
LSGRDRCFGAFAACHSEFKRRAANQLGYGTAANAASANQHTGVSFANRHTEALQIRFEFASGNAGDFGAYTA